MRTVWLAADAMTIAEEMAATGNPNSSDAGVGLWRFERVSKVPSSTPANLQDLEDARRKAIVAEADALWADIDAREARVLDRVAAVLGGAA